MVVQIPEVLAATEVEQIAQAINTVEFVDGKLAAGWYAKQVKHNQLLPSNTAKEIRDTIYAALQRNPLFHAPSS